MIVKISGKVRSMKWFAQFLVIVACGLSALGLSLKENNHWTEPTPVLAKEMKQKETSKYQMVTVKKGDTLFKIAKEHHTTVDQIVQVNHIKNSALIRIGQSIKVPISKSFTKQTRVGEIEKAVQSISKGLNELESNKKTLTITRGKVLGEFTLLGATVPLDRKELAVGISVGVDPKMIPIGSRIYIEGVGYRIAQDASNRVEGKQMELYVSSTALAQKFGTKEKIQVELVD